MANISAIQLPDGVTYDIKDDISGFITGMTILSYGSSTWQDFLDAYNAKKVVYCRASSNSNPASGSQTRLAFMAYVSNADNPTNVEFQYYRSVSTHTASQQGDQVYIYKLDKTAGWSVIVREASVKVVAGTGLSGTYSNGTMTLTGPTISLNGSSTTSPSFYAPTTAGTSGQVLTSNGSGAPTWTTAQSGDNSSLFPIYVATQSSLGEDRYLVNVTEEEIWQAYEDGKILILIDNTNSFIVTNYSVEEYCVIDLGEDNYLNYGTIWFNHMVSVWDTENYEVETSSIHLYGIHFNLYDDSNYSTYFTPGNLFYQYNKIPRGFKSTTVSLGTSGWSSNSKTVNVTGISPSSNVIVSPAPASYDNYVSAGIYCSGQSSGTLTFTCTTVPSTTITVNVLYTRW